MQRGMDAESGENHLEQGGGFVGQISVPLRWVLLDKSWTSFGTGIWVREKKGSTASAPLLTTFYAPLHCCCHRAAYAGLLDQRFGTG